MPVIILSRVPKRPLARIPGREVRQQSDLTAAPRPARTPAVVKPLPFERWPGWAKKVAEHVTPADESIVDIIEREVAPLGSDDFKLWYAETFGVWAAPCNCRRESEAWRVRYSFPRS